MSDNTYQSTYSPLNVFSNAISNVASNSSTSKKIDDLRSVHPFRKNIQSFDINSYNWSEHNSLSTNSKDTVQKIIIQEFQPDPILDVGKLIDTFIDTTISGLGDLTTNRSIAGTEKNFFGVMFGAALTTAAVGTGYALENELMKAYYKNPDEAINFPMKIIKQMFPGHSLNSYEMPFFEKKYLTTSTGAGTWEKQGATRALGNKLQTFLNHAMSVDFPTAPIWRYGGTSTDDFDFSFYLINDDEHNLYNNFVFLHSLISGSFWMQMSVMQKSPNIYKVIIPGRFTKHFCNITISVDMNGKLRRNEKVLRKINSNGCTLPSTTMFPDVYQLTLHVEDLTPNHFNNYVNYLINGDAGSVGDLINIDNKSRAVSTPADIVSEVGGTTIGNDLKALSDRATSAISSGTNTVSNAVKSIFL